MTKSEIIRFLILRTIGNFLVLFALYGVGATFGPALYYEVQFRIIQVRGVTYSVPNVKRDSFPSTPARAFGSEVFDREAQTESAQARRGQNDKTGGGFASVLAGPKEQILIPPDTDFSIVIPKIGASAKIFANVDATNEKEFLPVLQSGVAHARGTVFPGMKGNVYLFAHSTDNFWSAGRYNAVFYLLKDLQAGDDVIMFFENRRHSYRVSESRIVDPLDVSYLIDAQSKNDETLILQTCWPPGTTWKRLIVIAKPK